MAKNKETITINREELIKVITEVVKVHVLPVIEQQSAERAFGLVYDTVKSFAESAASERARLVARQEIGMVLGRKFRVVLEELDDGSS